MKYTYFIFALLLGMLLWAGTAGAQVYKWVDENGNVHYGDTPVKPEQAERLRMQRTPQSVRDAQAAAAQKAEDGEDLKSRLANKAEEKQQSEEEKQKTAERDAQLKKYCDGLLSHMNILKRGGRLTTMNAKGEQEWYDEARIKKELAETQSEYNSRCKGKK